MKLLPLAFSALAAALLAGCTTAPPPAPVPTEPVRVRLLALNDYHGNLKALPNALRVPDPANPGATVSVFDALDQAVAGLLTPGQSGTQIAQIVSTGIGNVDAAMNNFASARARAGEALNRADGMSERLSQTKLDAETERSNATDLDMLAAISDFQNRQTGYDAALKTYSMVQRMSLFDYLK